MTSYFRRFVEGYATIAKPLSDLLRKGSEFRITDEVVASFQQLKLVLTRDPVLKLFNVNAATEVHTDASKYGYGAVLLQKDSEDNCLHPVQYMSRKTTPAEEKYHSYELEVLAIIEALKKWRVYLMGIKFKIVTDCNAFAMTMKKAEVPLRVSRWAMMLQDFDYEIEHRSGTKMKHVDALSRISCMLIEDSLRYRLKEAQMDDRYVKALRKILENNQYEDYYIHHDILFKDPAKELVVVPNQMEEEVIMIAHRKGHFGAKKTQEYVEKYFFIPDLSAKVPKVIASCVECLVINSKVGKKEGLLSPIGKEDQPLNTYHIDHVGPMTLTGKQYKYILVVVDGFSKFVWLYPTKDTGAEAVISRLEKQAAIFGNPKRIISDRGTAFTSNAFQQYCENQGIQHFLIATGVPRGNGQVERMHQILVPMLAKLSRENPNQWYRHIDRVQQYINNTPTRSTCFSPFKILTGCDMRLSDFTDIREALEYQAIEDLDMERDKIREDARENIARIQEENRKTFNRNRRQDEDYKLNELVAIKRTQYGVGLKLKDKYLGPYRIVRKLKHGRYEVEKIGEVEGPKKTHTVAEYMKRWPAVFGANTLSGGPNVGSEVRRTTRSTTKG